MVRGYVCKVSIHREGYGVLQSGATRMCRCASILEDRINIDGLDQSPVVIDQGSEASGTSSRPLVAINDPISRARSISGKSHGSASRHFVIARHFCDAWVLGRAHSRIQVPRAFIMSINGSVQWIG